METKKEGISARSAYKRHTAQFKGQALELGDRDGIAKVPQDLGVVFCGLWVKKAAYFAKLPKSATSGAKADGRFGRDHFVYHPEQNEYSCPAGEQLKWRYSRIEGNLTMHRYWSSACQQCVLKAKCTPSQNRRVGRWEHEEVLEAMQKRLDKSLEAMRVR